MRTKKAILHNFLGKSYVSSGEYLFECPFCKHHKRKFSVNIEKGVYKCWICDKRGANLYRLVKMFGSQKDRNDWVTYFDVKPDLTEFEALFGAPISTQEAPPLDMPPGFQTLCTLSPAKRPLAYLRNRGISPSDVLKWKVGFCSHGPYGGRVVIPSFNQSGELNFFVARSYINHNYRYKNPQVSRDIIFNELYVDFDSELTLVEGVFDAMKASNAVPLLGSTLREDSVLFKKIIKYDTPVLLALDPDAAYKSTNIKKLFLKYGIELREIQYTDDRDIGDKA